jgi:hypothetical protein
MAPRTRQTPLDLVCQDCGAPFQQTTVGATRKRCHACTPSRRRARDAKRAAARGDHEAVAAIQQGMAGTHRPQLTDELKAAKLAAALAAVDDVERAAGLCGLDANEARRLEPKARTDWAELSQGGTAPLFRLLHLQTTLQVIEAIGDVSRVTPGSRAGAIRQAAQAVSDLHATSTGGFSNDIIVQWVEVPEGSVS